MVTIVPRVVIKPPTIKVPRGVIKSFQELSNLGTYISRIYTYQIADMWLRQIENQHRAYLGLAYTKLEDARNRWNKRSEGARFIALSDRLNKNLYSSRQRSFGALQDITGGKPPSTGDFRLSQNKDKLTYRISIVDPTYLSRILLEADRAMRLDLFKLARDQFEPIIPSLLIQTFQEIAAPLEDGAFPKEYLEGIEQVILSHGRFAVTGTDPTAVYVHMENIFDKLGDSQQLREGYHYGAMLQSDRRERYSSRVGRFRDSKGLFMKFKSIDYDRRSSNTVSLPYTGQALRSGLKSRYTYWKAMYEGRSSVFFAYKVFYPRISASETKTIKVEIDPGAWEDTKAARVYYWKTVIGKAPQWLLLEYGQTRFKPTIPVHAKSAGKPVGGAGGMVNVPGNISKVFYEKLIEKWNALVISVWTEAWRKAEQGVRPYGERLSPERVAKFVRSTSMDSPDFWKTLSPAERASNVNKYWDDLNYKPMPNKNFYVFGSKK